MTDIDATTRRVAGAGAPGDEAVRKATGRDWATWLAELDADGAAALDHGGIVKLARARGAGDWWAQMVTVHYERARGRRAVRENRGGFSVSASRTIGASADRIYAAFTDPAERSTWLAEPLVVTTSTPARSIRARWADGTRIDVGLVPKGPDRTQVALQHEKLADADTADAMKAFWAARLDTLRGRLEGS